MKGKTRAYNNQCILRSERNLLKVYLNMLRILDNVNLRGEYPEIRTSIENVISYIIYTRTEVIKLQSLFNDSRATKIGV